MTFDLSYLKEPIEMHNWTIVPFSEPTCSELDLLDTFLSDSVCGRPSVRPTLRHCIRTLLNQPITVLRLIGFSNKNEQSVCSWFRNVTFSKTLFQVIRLRLCLEVKRILFTHIKTKIVFTESECNEKNKSFMHIIFIKL